MTLPSYYFDASTDKPLTIDMSRGTYSKVEPESPGVEKHTNRLLASELAIAGMICAWSFARVNVFGYGAVFVLLTGALAQPVLRGHPSAPLVHLCVLYAMFVSEQFETGMQSINPSYHIALLLYVTVFPPTRRILLCIPATMTTIVATFVVGARESIVFFTVHVINDCVFGIVLCAVCWKEKSE